MRVVLVITSFILAATTVFASGTRTIIGTWNTEENKAKVEIFQCGENICGKITWLKEPLYIDAKEGTVGIPKLDNNNPELALRDRPRIGLHLMNGFVQSSENTWEGGTIYDPENGKTYKCIVKMISPEQLEVCGYIGISMFGRTSIWTR